MNTCVVSSFASALSYISTKPHHEYIKKAADRLAELAKSLEGKDIQVCLNQIRGVMEAYVPSIARYTKANVHRKKRKKNVFIKNQLFELMLPFPTLVVPIGSDGSVSHAVTVVDDLIFDSTQKYALKLGPQSLDWVCGECGCRTLGLVVRFQHPLKGKKTGIFSDLPVNNWTDGTFEPPARSK